MDNIIEFDNFTVCFPKRTEPIFSSLSFSIPRHSIFGVFGETGCGKSTLALSLIGLLQSGIQFGTFRLFFNNIIYDNATMTEQKWETIRGRKILYVPQDPYKTLHPWKTIQEQLTLIQSLGHSNLSEILDLLKLDRRILNLYPRELSAGQVQRCMIASALAANPELYIFDEPTASIDIEGRQIILDCFQTLQKQGATLIVISHEVQKYKEIIQEQNIFYFHSLAQNEVVKKQNYIVSQKKLLELKQVYKTYVQYPVLQNINFCIHENEWSYIQGTNGAGKSTLLHIILGLLKPNQGEFFWRDEPILWKNLIKKTSRFIHCVFQDSSHSLDPSWTMKKSLQEIIKQASQPLQKLLEEQAEKLWILLELPEPLKNYVPNQLSYGQQKRVAIIRSILKYYLYRNKIPSSYHLFLLDEIFSGLHWALRNKILSFFQDLRQNNDFSILWIAHAQDDLLLLCDSTYILNKSTFQQERKKNE